MTLKLSEMFHQEANTPWLKSAVSAWQKVLLAAAAEEGVGAAPLQTATKHLGHGFQEDFGHWKSTLTHKDAD